MFCRLGYSILNPMVSNLVSNGELMNRGSLCWAISLWLWGVAFAEQPVTLEPAGPILTQLKADLKYLSSDELRGRSSTDASIHVAADYIAGRMSEIGLKTDLFDGGALQPLTIPVDAKAGAADKNRVSFKVAGREAGEDEKPLRARLGKSMHPMAIGALRGSTEGRVVFAGYGITAPKLDYDDYQGVDADGATVIVLRKEPGVNDPDSPFDGTRNTSHAFFQTKIKNAMEHGAAAIIIVNDPASVLQAVTMVRNKIDQERSRREKATQQLDSLPAEATNSRAKIAERMDAIDRSIEALNEELKQAQRGLLGIAAAGNGGGDRPKIPVATVARDVIDRLLRLAAGKSLESLEQTIDQTWKPASQSLADARVELEVELKPNEASTANVLGVLEGRGTLAEETVVIGAHYDHVGMGGYGSLAPGTVAIHNGADDNASGTSALLAVATQIVSQLSDESSHRRMVFIAFTGEERGLLGSKYYVKHPRFSLGSTVAMLNLDMVGRLRDNELTVYGTGSADSLEQMLDQANEQGKFDLYKVASGYGPSDHQSFYEAGVPVLFFFTGLHNDYHRPSDDFDKIDFGGMVRITDMVSDVALKLANS